VDTAPLAVGARLSLWNGDGDNQGSNPKSWESCDAKPCTAKVAAELSVGKDSSSGLHFRGDGPQFIGGGWNLFGWYPADAGIDISRYDTLQFWLKIESESPALMPDEINVALGGSGDNNSAFAPVSRADKKFNDGQWHLIEIPLTALRKGEGKNFNPQSVWEFRINTWNAVPKKFDAFVDEIAVVKKH
jgi:hypothetical protein